MLNPDVVDVILAKKKTKTPRKTQKNNNLQKTKRILISKCQLKRGQFLHLVCQGDQPAPPAPRQLRHYSQTVEEAIRHLHKLERKRSTPVRRRLSRAQAILGRITPTGWVPVSGMNTSFTNTYCNKALWTSLIRKTAKCRTHDRLFRFG